MARYVYRHSNLWVENSRIVDQELEELQRWISSYGIDDEFEIDRHVYVTETGDRWIHIPELSQSQLFAMQMILSSSELYYQDQHVTFKTAPVTKRDLAEQEEQDDV